MTERLKGLTVFFEEAIREDEAESILKAVGCLRGVLSVEPIGTTANDHWARLLAKRELADKIWHLLRE